MGQKGDIASMGGEVGVWLPETPAEFGQRLRALRARRSLRRLESEQDSNPASSLVLSKSQLARYEAGQTLPPLEYAAHLDDLYQGEGWVEVALRGLWRSRWDPWASATSGPSRIHSALWPAALSGVVWLKIKPTVDNLAALHHFDLEWGPWQRRIDVVIPEEGALIFTGKARDDDGIPRTFNVTCDKRVFLLHGAGDSFDDEGVIVDIRRGWRVAPGERGDSASPGSLLPDR